MDNTSSAGQDSAALKAPQVSKVDPPSWWIRHSLNPVRLLISGRRLGEAQILSSSPDLLFGPIIANAKGTYLFVDMQIMPDAKAGKRNLTIQTPEGKIEIPFELLEPLKKENSPKACSPDDLIYLIMPDRFARGGSNSGILVSDGMVNRQKARYYHGGNLQGIMDHLPYLNQLGITALWLTPLYANTNKLYPGISWFPKPFSDYHGYGPVDYYAVDRHLGTLSQLQELVKRAHEVGIKIILDQVVNHTGSEHPWLKDPPTDTWYYGSPKKHLNNTFQSWVLTDPYSSKEMVRSVIEGWFCEICPDLNQDDPEIVRYMIQNILWWLGMSGADGLRQDSVGLIPRNFWKEYSAALHREYPDFRTIGEYNDDTPVGIASYQGGRPGFDGIDTGLDILYDFPLRKAIRGVFLDGDPIEKLPVILGQDRLYVDPTFLINCFGLHDDRRFMGHPKATIEALKLAFAFIMTTRGIPLIYYGDEIAMRGGKDPDNRRDFPGGWPDDPRNAFVPKGRSAKEESVFQYVTRLTRLRSECKALRSGRLINLSAGQKVYAYARLSDSEEAIIMLNNGDKTEKVEFGVDSLMLSQKKSVLKDELGDAKAKLEEGRMVASLPAKTAAIYILRS